MPRTRNRPTEDAFGVRAGGVNLAEGETAVSLVATSSGAADRRDGRPGVYLVVYLDALVVKIRDKGMVVNKSVYLVVGLLPDGSKDVLGMWIAPAEGAKFWLSVLSELRQRGVRDILVLCADGLTGLPEAAEASFPPAVFQTCIVHMVRSSMRFRPLEGTEGHVRQPTKHLHGAQHRRCPDRSRCLRSPLGTSFPHDRVPLLHTWEHTIGSGHATLALRADWQRQLTRCRRELGFRNVRFHGLLSDDVGTLVRESDELVYSFFNADQICDFLLSIDMRPFVELSFMPTALASGGETVFHYRGNVTPPKDYDAWETLIRKFAHHVVERYGLAEVSRWFFEVWNEPNLKAFWTGTQADYFRLYERAARALKEEHGSLKVGGPATADNQWIAEFVSFCKASAVPVDFVSTHHYPTDAFGKPGDDTVTQLAQSKRSVLREEAAKARDEAGGHPLYYTEWSTSSNPFDDLHDQPYAAAFVAKTVMEVHGIVHGYSYWTFSDIFEENYFTSKPFHGGFGLLTIHGVPKPTYRAFEILHRLGDEILPVAGHHQTVDVWVSRSGRFFRILLTNGALPRHAIRDEIVRLQLSGVKEIRTAHIERIDEDHANARRAWIEMGQPGVLLPRHVAALETASALIKTPVVWEASPDLASLDVAVPAQGMALLTLELA